MAFKYEIPMARWRDSGFRAADGHLVKTLKKVRRCGKRGTRNRRLIATHEMRDGTEHVYHATKGWRSYRGDK